MSKVDETRKFWSDKFDEFDASGNGQLTIQELRDALKGMNVEISDADIATMFREIDDDDSRSISKAEFIKEMTKKNRQDAFREFFAENDIDKSGALTADEIQKFADRDCKASVDKILKECDANCDGKITLEEYLSKMDE